MAKLFKIIDFDKNDAEILATIRKGNKSKELTIKADSFERWLERSERLYWENNYSDSNGDHCQELGKYSPSEYWSIMPAKAIECDLYDYILINLDNMEAAFQSIQQICAHA